MTTSWPTEENVDRTMAALRSVGVAVTAEQGRAGLLAGGLPMVVGLETQLERHTEKSHAPCPHCSSTLPPDPAPQVADLPPMVRCAVCGATSLAVAQDTQSRSFTAATDAVLLENGWDPQWITHDPEQNGPFAVTRVPTECGCCGGNVFGWTVINLATATGTSSTWSDEAGEIDAEEHANTLNWAWLEGHRAALASVSIAS